LALLIATVAAIPVARQLVVAVVTVIISLVSWESTRPLAWCAFGIKTLAFITVKKLFRVGVSIVTAIAAIPIAILIVVLIIAVSVTLALRILAVVYFLFAVATLA